MADSKKLKDEQLEDVAGGLRFIIDSSADIGCGIGTGIGTGIDTGAVIGGGSELLKTGSMLDSSAAITNAYKCKTCGHTWEDAKVPAECPLCRSTEIMAVE